jgi:hypothetical protein
VDGGMRQLIANAPQAIEIVSETDARALTGPSVSDVETTTSPPPRDRGQESRLAVAVTDGAQSEPVEKKEAASREASAGAAAALELDFASLDDDQRSGPVGRLVGDLAVRRDGHRAQLHPCGCRSPEERDRTFIGVGTGR